MTEEESPSGQDGLLDGAGFIPQSVALMSPRILAWIDIEPKLPRRRLEVWRAANRQPGGEATLDELERVLGWRINRISGRVSELVEVGWLIDSTKRRDGQTVWRTARGRTDRAGSATRVVRRAGEVVAMKMAHDLATDSQVMEITVRMAPGVRPVEGARATIAWRTDA
jgi:hypothetical protein